MKLIYVKAIEKDWSTVQSLLKEAVKTTSGLYRAHTEKESVIKLIHNNQVFLIMKSATLVGLISYSWENPHCAYVDELLIRPEFKGQGYGTQTMIWLFDQVKNAEKISLNTHPQNSRAIMLYLKSGFIIDGWNDNFFGDGEPRIHMVKLIKNSV